VTPSSQEITQRVQRPAPAEEAAPPPQDPVEALAVRLLDEMDAAWHGGQRPPAEDFLARHPELASRPEAAVRLVYEEVCLREEAGEEDVTEEVINRFPQWRAELAALLDCHRLLQQSALGRPSFPEVGQTLGEMRLLRELGRGAKGRVFLGAEPFLADRPVVLKLAPRDGREHLALARLQHMHIVPLYGAHDFPDRGLLALCMPYLGGTTLGRVLELLRGQSPAERSGMQLVQALDQGRAAPVDLPGPAPARWLLAQSTYAEAICWIAACLAEALQHAHERGLMHLDLKPSNVLLAADGTPMLLDFHLAREPLRRGAPVPDWFGGTRDYMAPEQRQTMEAVRQRQPVPEDVDGRADVYGLGLLLYEALGGRLPDREGGPVPLRRLNPRVSPGLSDIIHKCLAPAPKDRYQTAGALAVDVRRHLDDLPLRGVPNRNLAERWRKWRRRRPHALALGGLLLLLTVATAGAVVLGTGWFGQRIDAATAALADGRGLVARKQYQAGIDRLRQGLDVAAATPGAGGLAGELHGALRAAEQLRAAAGLHDLAERTRFLYDSESLSPEAARTLEEGIGRLWQERDRIRAADPADLGPGGEEQVRQDFLDLALFRAELALRQPRANEGARSGDRAPTAAPREALRVLGEAEAELGQSPALARERQACAEAAGDADAARQAARQAAGLTPRTAWDHDTLGRFLMRHGDLKVAAAEFAQAVTLEPGGFWPYFHRGACLYRLGQHAGAVRDFTVCIARAPATAAGYYNRGLVEAAQGETAAALEDYEAALRHDPRLGAAALNRGVLLLGQRHYAEALADLQRARDAGADPAAVHYNRALAYEGLHDPEAARAEAERALRFNSHHRDARRLLDRLGGTR
jgi:serine/threonine protein kinase/tetratricopeptide (TPR) repeat protein